MLLTAILSAAALPVYASPNDDIKDVISQCYKSTDPDTVIRSCYSAIESNPKNADAYKYRGFGYSDKGDYDRAIQDFDLAIQDFDQGLRLEPNNAVAISGRDLASRKGGGDQYMCWLEMNGGK